jgi:hypothetical protein
MIRNDEFRQYQFKFDLSKSQIGTKDGRNGRTQAIFGFQITEMENRLIGYDFVWNGVCNRI